MELRLCWIVAAALCMAPLTSCQNCASKYLVKIILQMLVCHACASGPENVKFKFVINR